jgi:hypothetical protein
MYLVLDNATNNILAEFATFAEAEHRRIELVGANPTLAEYILVVDLDKAVAEDEARHSAAAPAAAGC